MKSHHISLYFQVNHFAFLGCQANERFSCVLFGYEKNLEGTSQFSFPREEIIE